MKKTTDWCCEGQNSPIFGRGYIDLEIVFYVNFHPILTGIHGKILLILLYSLYLSGGQINLKIILKIVLASSQKMISKLGPDIVVHSYVFLT